VVKVSFSYWEACLLLQEVFVLGGAPAVQAIQRTRHKVTGLRGICAPSPLKGEFLVQSTTKTPYISRLLPCKYAISFKQGVPHLLGFIPYTYKGYLVKEPYKSIRYSV
jgi:hypothetical protein